MATFSPQITYQANLLIKPAAANSEGSTRVTDFQSVIDFGCCSGAGNGEGTGNNAMLSCFSDDYEENNEDPVNSNFTRFINELSGHGPNFDRKEFLKFDFFRSKSNSSYINTTSNNNNHEDINGTNSSNFIV